MLDIKIQVLSALIIGGLAGYFAYNGAHFRKPGVNADLTVHLLATGHRPALRYVIMETGWQRALSPGLYLQIQQIQIYRRTD
jgi:hypothetical protein